MIVPPSLAMALKLAVATSLTDLPISAVDTAPRLRHHHSHSSSSHNNHDNTSSSTYYPSSPANFDFYVYSMTYQPEFCRENSNHYSGCHHPSQFWEGQLTIHGLWPQRNDGTWPSECTAEPLQDSFYVKGNDSILELLEEKWPNVKSDPNSRSHRSFWEHEWTKHGTCSGLIQFDYFQNALNLLLATPEVVAKGYGDTVSKAELVEGYGGESMAALVCKSGYLSEVRACFGKNIDGTPGERMECPEKVLEEGSCGEEIRIASFDGTSLSVE